MKYYHMDRSETYLYLRRFSKKLISERSRGQSLIEMAMLFPVLIILVTGMVEFGFLLNQYLSIVDAARNAARFSSDSLFYMRESGNSNCDPLEGTVSTDFYFQTACLAIQELYQESPTIEINLGQEDDIIISAFTVEGGSGPTVSARHPAPGGWSYAEAVTGKRNRISKFTDEQVIAKLRSGVPSTGLIMVEIFFNYKQLLELPWITAFLDNPLRLHAYTFMPLVSAEPTPIPLP